MVSKPLPTLIKESLSLFQQELDAVRDIISLPETEETWDDIGRAIMRFTALLKDNSSEFPHELTGMLRSLSRPLNSAINSERTRLSGIAVDLIGTVAEVLKGSFEPLLPLFLPTLLTLCTRTNKVFVSRARVCITAIIEQTHSVSILSYLTESVKDKSISLRQTAAESVLICLRSFQPTVLDKEPRIVQLESIIKVTATDASADVRKISRKIFDAYKVLFPRRVDQFTEPLTPTIRKYLDIKLKPPSQAKQPSRTASAQSSYSGHGPSRTRMLSSSTSALHHSSSTAQNVIRSRTRDRAFSSSESSAQGGPSTRTAKRNPTAPLDGVAIQVGAKRSGGMPVQKPGRTAVTDMAPPNNVPIRTRDTQTVSTGEPGKSSGQDMSAMRRGPSRPGPMTTMASASHSQSTSGSNSHPESGRPEAEPRTTATRPPENYGGKSGPLRPLSDDACKTPLTHDTLDKSGRVVGGARRVLLTHATDCAQSGTFGPKHKDVVAGETSSHAPSLPTSIDLNASIGTTSTQDSVAPLKRINVKDNGKPVPIAQASAAKAIALPLSGTTTEDEHLPKGRGGRLAPSLSKASTVRKGPKGAKPVWGRAAASVKVNAASRVSPEISNKMVQNKLPSERVVGLQTLPEETPLPPSPIEAKNPTSVPLPPSPTLRPFAERTPTRATIVEKTPTPILFVEETITPQRQPNANDVLSNAEQTPISALVASIEQGFLFTPGAPLSPPVMRLEHCSSFILTESDAQWDGAVGSTARLNVGRMSCEYSTGAFDDLDTDDKRSHQSRRVPNDLHMRQQIG
ncbi:clasp N terminal-domain-containing protein [Sparassis latifolia]|uniref:TOG domain-containing protein n=1 Tax=Sparassis crispa TaxID=139825 RepID=A0A401GFQ7_9APHY|nr:hypothetical protein SCP_0306840 [Sparassis crispa]GBE80961.1 hypothetical protein SCP_0306840 [Sparassis crispa]